MKKVILLDPELGEINLVKPESKTLRRRAIERLRKRIAKEKAKRPKDKK